MAEVRKECHLLRVKLDKRHSTACVTLLDWQSAAQKHHVSFAFPSVALPLSILCLTEETKDRYSSLPSARTHPLLVYSFKHTHTFSNVCLSAWLLFCMSTCTHIYVCLTHTYSTHIITRSFTYRYMLTNVHMFTHTFCLSISVSPLSVLLLPPFFLSLLFPFSIFSPFFLSDWLSLLSHLSIFNSFPCSFSSVIYSSWFLVLSLPSFSFCALSPSPVLSFRCAHWLAFPFSVAHIHTRVALLWWEDHITLTQYLKCYSPPCSAPVGPGPAFSPRESDWVSKLQRWALYSCH